MKDVDLLMGTLESAIGSIGGFCVGTTYVVEHQTLAGLGKTEVIKANIENKLNFYFLDLSSDPL